MIEDVSIKDFALIDSVNLEFNKGFTVFSGETGAGKSILIGAISFLLGGKATLDLIRTGTHEARVSGTLYIPESQKDAKVWLEEHGIEPENDRVMLRRIVRDTGKTAAWIQDTPVTRVELAELTSFFVDIHGQHEHQSLMRVPEHRRFLDAYAGITDEVAEVSKLYTKLVQKRETLEQLNTSDSEKQNKIELLSFAVKEIEEAKLKKDEDVLLEAEESKLSQYEKLYTEIEDMSSLLNNENANIVSMLKKLRATSERASEIDTSLSNLSQRIDSSFYEISDIAEELRNYQQSMVFDPARLEEVQDRLSFIYKLKKKYAPGSENSVSEILKYAASAQEQLEKFSSSDEDKKNLEKEIAILEKDLFAKAKKISECRHSAGTKMATGVENVLNQLGMKGTQFSVDITTKPGDSLWQKCGAYGFDNIEFLISANAGSPLKPLAKIASGGELSRVMLALKTILAASDTVDTLIFDEIDTGIGGEVSVAVGAHLKKLAEKKQILCITHLASIAVYADNQLKIEKKNTGNMTETSVSYICGERRVEEVARMLSGDTNSSVSLEHAKSLLQTYRGD